MTHDEFFQRKYDIEKYNCVHFAHEVSLKLYHKDRSDALQLFMKQPKDIQFVPSKIKMLHPLPLPVEGCIVAFHPIDNRLSPHVGVYREGRVLHIREQGVSWMNIDAIKLLGFSRVSFYD